jgi:hypothetical protein
MLVAAKAEPGGPDYADLKAAALHLNDLVAEIGEPPPPRAEAVASWARETAQAARDLLRRFGVDVKTLAAGGAALSPDARENLEIALEPALGRAGKIKSATDKTLDAKMPRGLVRHVAIYEPHERHKAIAPAIEALALLALATEGAAIHWQEYVRPGATAKDATRKLAIRGAAAYRAGTGEEPGLNPEGPFGRFLGEVAEKLGIEISPAAAVSVWRREIENNTERSPEADGLPE